MLLLDRPREMSPSSSDPAKPAVAHEYLLTRDGGQISQLIFLIKCHLAYYMSTPLPLPVIILTLVMVLLTHFMVLYRATRFPS